MNELFFARSVTFSNGTGAFAIGGERLVVGYDGGANFDAQTMTFTNIVDFIYANDSVINAAAGLIFANLIELPVYGLVVTGSGPTISMRSPPTTLAPVFLSKRARAR